MINDLLQNILLFLATALNFILTPFDNFLASTLPDINNPLLIITGFFNQLAQVSGWVLSYFGLTDDTLSIIVLGLIAPVTLSLIVLPIKLGMRWYNNLKIG